MSTIGKLHNFKSGSETIDSYLERVDLYLKANSIAEDKRVPFLLTALGPTMYTRLRELLAPDNLAEKSYDDLTTALRNYYEPKRVIIAERFRFNQRNQVVEESVTEYLAALRKPTASSKAIWMTVYGTVLSVDFPTNECSAYCYQKRTYP